MSKSIAALSELLKATNEQLFDRYINFSLMQGTELNASTDIIFKTPLQGIKPAITVTGDLHVQNTANLITLSVMNINANIDTMLYNYAEIEMGYVNSGISVRFKGQITNCYMSKPNPNGELVVSIVNAPIADMYSSGDIVVSFAGRTTVLTAELIRTCLNAIVAAKPALAGNLLEAYAYIASVNGSVLWKVQSFEVNGATYRFKSPLECISWLNSLFASYTYNTGFATGAGRAPKTGDAKEQLPPLMLCFDYRGQLVVRALYSGKDPTTVRALTSIGSAYLTSTSSATVTAPFNPGLSPGELVYINTKYFKTRVNIQNIREAYSSMGNLWYVISTQFTFSTFGANTMTLMLNNTNNVVKMGEG